MYCNLYMTTLKSSKSSMTSTFDGSTIGVWWWHHNHAKVNKKGKISALYRGFSSGKTYDMKEKVVQEGKNSLHKSKVYELVKLFEDKFVVKEEAKLMVWKKMMVQ